MGPSSQSRKPPARGSSLNQFLISNGLAPRPPAPLPSPSPVHHPMSPHPSRPLQLQAWTTWAPVPLI